MTKMIRSRQPEQTRSNFWKVFSIFLICFTIISEIYLVIIIYQKNSIIDNKQAKINNLMTEIQQVGIQQKEKERKRKIEASKQEMSFNTANFISVKQFELFKKRNDREINRLKREINRLKTRK